MGKSKQASVTPLVPLVDVTGTPLLYPRYTTLDDILQGRPSTSAPAPADHENSPPAKKQKKQASGPAAAAAFLAQQQQQSAAPAAAEQPDSVVVAPQAAPAVILAADPWQRGITPSADTDAAATASGTPAGGGEGQAAPLSERMQQKRAIRAARQAERAAELAAEAAAAAGGGGTGTGQAAAGGTAAAAPANGTGPQPPSGLSRKQRRALAAAEKVMSSVGAAQQNAVATPPAATGPTASPAVVAAAQPSAQPAAGAGNADEARKIRALLGLIPLSETPQAAKHVQAPQSALPEATAAKQTLVVADAIAIPAATAGPPPVSVPPATAAAAGTAGGFSFGFSVAQQIEMETEAKVSKLMAQDISKDGFTPRRVFICGMPIEWSEADVREYWGACGTIESLDLMVFPDSGRFKGVLFLTFATQTAYEAALAADGEELEGRRLRVEKCKTAAERRPAATPSIVGASPAAPAASRPARAENYNVAYVGNIAYNATEADLRKLFDPVGAKVIRMHTDKKTGAPKGFAHVHFADAEALEKAVLLDGSMLCERPIRVTYGQPKKA